MKLTQSQIEQSKGKCPDCQSHGYTLSWKCETCNNSGKATIEIEKEYDTFDNKPITLGYPKHQVGDDIRICGHCFMEIQIRNPSGYCDHLYYPDNCEECKLIVSIGIKIISETETHWRIVSI